MALSRETGNRNSWRPWSEAAIMEGVSAAANTLTVTADEHGEIHVPAADAARLGVEPGQTVALAATPRPKLRPLPKTLTIDQLAERQGKKRGTVRSAADFPRL